MKPIKLCSILVLAGLMLLGARGVFAVADTLSGTGEGPKTLDDSAPRMNLTPEVCADVEAKITEKIERFETHKEAHLAAYEQAVAKINKLIGWLKAHGYQTAQLEADLEVFNTKIKELAVAYAVFIEKLRLTQQYACGESHGAFVRSLGASRYQLDVFKSAVADARNYYQTVIRADIAELRDQVRISGATVREAQ